MTWIKIQKENINKNESNCYYTNDNKYCDGNNNGDDDGTVTTVIMKIRKYNPNEWNRNNNDHRIKL